MQNKKELIKVGLLFAVIITCGIFIWRASAGVWKFDSTKSTVAKINTSQVGRWTGGLVGYWTFDGQDTNWAANTTSDKSGQNNTGTMTNMSTTTSPQPGKIGQALNFDGTDDYVNIPDSFSSLSSGTIGLWIKVNVASYDGGIASSNSHILGYDFLQFSSDVSNNSFRYQIFDSSSYTFWANTPANSILPGNWYYVVLTVDSSGNKIFINGVQQSLTYTCGNSSSQVFFNTVNALQETYIGRFLYAGTYYTRFNGLIDEVRIYNRALSAGEILEMYNAGAGGHINP